MRLIDADALMRLIPMEEFVARIAIADAPTVDVPERNVGKWLWMDGVRCSRCNFKLQTTGLPTSCPNCGAKMQEGGAE